MAAYGVVLFCVGVLAAGALASILPLRPLPPTELVLLLGAAVLSIWLPLRIERRGATQGFTLEEGIFVAMLFVLPLGAPAALATLAAFIAHIARRAGWLKVLFNTGQVALWSSAGVLVFTLVEPGPNVLTARSLVAVVAAVIAANVVSLSALAGLFRRLRGHSLRDTVGEAWRLNAATAVGNTSFGLVLAIVIAVDPWAAALAASLMVGLYLGYRGYAHMLRERGRQDRLHEMTQALAESPTTGDPEAFLSGLRKLFGAGRSGIALAGRGASWAADEGVWSDELHAEDPLFEAMKGSRPRQKRHEGEEVLAAPVVYEGRTLGAIAVYGRIGLEPWDDADLTLLSTVAHEAAVALKNVELFQQVERERARWEAESTKLGDVVNAASDGIAMLSSEGTIETWNEAMVSITGLPADQALGQPWFVVLRVRGSDEEDLLPGGDHIVSRAIDGRRYREPVDLQVLRRDGSWRYLRATFAPVQHEDTHPGGTVMVARDVTAEREVESLKADFVATVSHELRTPLTPLRGFLQTLVAHRKQLDEDQIETIYRSMDSQLGRLERLIADLLVVADLDRGATKLDVEQVNLLEAVTIAVRNEASSDTERVDISGEDDVVVVGDGKAVVRVIRALASNALKHTDERVEVHAERVGSEGVVRVRDHGPGIPPWEQKEIFKRFRRLGDHLTRNQGPGLGLPIAAALAARLGGKVTVESDVGEGSVFSLWLPLARPRVVDSVDTDSQAS